MISPPRVIPPPIISVNGHVMAADTPAISALDRGMTLGDGVFETMKVVDRVVWYLDQHLHRLTHGAARIGIQTLPPLVTLHQWITDVVGCLPVKEVGQVLRVTVTRGVAHGHALVGDDLSIPTVLITALPIPETSHRLYERGITAQVATVRRAEFAATAGLKTTNYLESILALREARTAGYDDTIVLDSRGFVAEGSASNVFLWRDGVLLTPSLTCGVLPGITRAIVLALAREQGIYVEERELRLDELLHADEAFLTSSIRGIIPLIRVGDTILGTGAPGQRTQWVMERYAVAPRTFNNNNQSVPFEH